MIINEIKYVLLLFITIINSDVKQLNENVVLNERGRHC